MRHIRKLLIATTNKGKFDEIAAELVDLPFALVSLADIPEKMEAPEESEPTLEGNALLKALYYGEKIEMLTLADDAGLFIDALNGFPGVKSSRIAENTSDRTALVLQKMRDVSFEKRAATFRTSLALFDPLTRNQYVTSGECKGQILDAPATRIADGSFGFDPIFYVEERKKAYAEMERAEKMSVSPRGMALRRMKIILMNEYGARHVVAPIALILDGRKILLSLRNDPYNAEFHRKWEFPGGGADLGETLEECVVRETKEEIGYDIEIISRLNHIHVIPRPEHIPPYQVYLVPFACRIVGGDGKHEDMEVIETRWFDSDEIAGLDLMSDNKRLFEIILPELMLLNKYYA